MKKRVKYAVCVLVFICAFLFFSSCTKADNTSGDVVSTGESSVNNTVSTKDEKAAAAEVVVVKQEIKEDTDHSDLDVVEDNPVTDVEAVEEEAKGHFVQFQKSIWYFVAGTEEELPGVFVSSYGRMDDTLKFSIYVSDYEIAFILKEKGEDKHLSTISSLPAYYSIVIIGESESLEIEGEAESNSNGKYNVICGVVPIDSYIRNDYLSITISNEYGTYDLGKINTSELEGLRYDKALYEEYLPVLEEMFAEKKYTEIMALLMKYEGMDSDTYYFYKGDDIYEQCLAGLYIEGLQYYLEGNYEEAYSKLSLCEGYKDSDDLVQECCYLVGYALLYKDDNPEKAKEYFEECSNYKDSSTLIDKCNEIIRNKAYTKAFDLYKNGEYLEAKKILYKSGFSKEDKEKTIQQFRKDLGKLCVGDTVLLGTDENGYEIPWIIIGMSFEYDIEKAMLLSEYILFAKEFSNTDSNMYWDNSTLKSFLNDTSSDGFYGGSFSSDEKEVMLKQWGCMINLPTVGDIESYLKTYSDRTATYRNGGRGKWFTFDCFKESQGTRTFVTYVSQSGDIIGKNSDSEKYLSTSSSCGVRPYIYVDLSKLDSLNK